MSVKREFISKAKEQFYQEIKNYQKTLKPTKEIEGYGSAPIVGEKNYPYLKTHNISNVDQESSFFNTGKIVKKDYKDVFKIKAKNILGSTDQSYIKKTDTRITEEVRDIYKSKKPIEFASEFEKELKFNAMRFNKATGIVGLKNPLLNLEATQNTSTSKQIEKYTTEDLKAKQAIINLYDKGINEHQIISLLSLGSFGVQINKKLVPTRWSITAYDKTIEQHIFPKIDQYSSIEKYEIYHHKDKGNEFVIVLIPHDLQGDIIETFGSNVLRDHFNVKNKLDKSEPATAGGYYAQKIAIFESLLKRKRKASIISIRTIDDYDIPLGVVFVRESVRAAMKKAIFKANTLEEAKSFLKQKYPRHLTCFNPSTTLKEIKEQKKLSEYF